MTAIKITTTAAGQLGQTTVMGAMPCSFRLVHCDTKNPLPGVRRERKQANKKNRDLLPIVCPRHRLIRRHIDVDVDVFQRQYTFGL